MLLTPDRHIVELIDGGSSKKDDSVRVLVTETRHGIDGIPGVKSGHWRLGSLVCHFLC